MAALGELAALRLPADLAPRAAALVERAPARSFPPTPGVRRDRPLRLVLRYRHEMIQELS